MRIDKLQSMINVWNNFSRRCKFRDSAGIQCHHEYMAEIPCNIYNCPLSDTKEGHDPNRCKSLPPISAYDFLNSTGEELSQFVEDWLYEEGFLHT